MFSKPSDSFACYNGSGGVLTRSKRRESGEVTSCAVFLSAALLFSFVFSCFTKVKKGKSPE